MARCFCAAPDLRFAGGNFTRSSQATGRLSSICTAFRIIRRRVRPLSRSSPRAVVASSHRGFAATRRRRRLGPYRSRDPRRGRCRAHRRGYGKRGAPVDIVGHDWGAVITYALCAAHPDRVRRAVTMAVPHPRTFLKRRSSGHARSRRVGTWASFRFLGASGSSPHATSRLIDRLWKKWSPEVTVSAEQRASLRECLAASWPAPLEYYRDMRRNAKRDLPALRAPIEVPLLYLHGANDGCVLPPTIDDRERFADEYEREVIDGLGHFMHVEDPHGLCDRIDRWLDRSAS